MLLTLFNEIPDFRRAQGKMYDLPHLLLFSVLAVLSGADSYRKVESFLTEHFKILKQKLEIKWKRPPGYTTIRYIIQGLDPSELEKAFRKYAQNLISLDPKKYMFINLDGKTVRGSFNHFQDKKAVQIFSAFLANKNIILAHEKVTKNKRNEISVARKLFKELGVKHCIFTLDALHCQKKQ